MVDVWILDRPHSSAVQFLEESAGMLHPVKTHTYCHLCFQSLSSH